MLGYEIRVSVSSRRSLENSWEPPKEGIKNPSDNTLWAFIVCVAQLKLREACVLKFQWFSELKLKREIKGSKARADGELVLLLFWDADLTAARVLHLMTW